MQLNVTFPGYNHRPVHTNPGTASEASGGCTKIKLYWRDGSVWCKGLKIGDSDCGGAGPYPPGPAPGPRPGPKPPPPPPVPPTPPFTVSVHIIEHTHDDVSFPPGGGFDDRIGNLCE